MDKPTDNYENYLRAIVSALHAQLALVLSRERYGKCFLDLSTEENRVVEELVVQLIGHYTDYWTQEVAAKMAGPWEPSKVQ